MDCQAISEESPAERRRQRVRAAILDAAERVYSQEGDSGFSIRRLAEEIDYSPAAIYKYFGSREELLEELREAFFERLMATVDRAALAALPFEARVLECFSRYIEIAIDRPHHYAAAFTATDDRGQDEGEPGCWEDFEKTQKGQAFMIVVGLVREGQETGVFDTSFDPFNAAKSLWASMHGVALLLIHIPGFPRLLPAQGQSLKTSEFIRFHAGLLFRSLCASPVSPAFSGHTQ